MSRLFTVLALVGRAQKRADLESDDHISTSEWRELLSEQYGDLHDVVAEAGYRYFESTSTISANGAASYTVPADFLSSTVVSRVLDVTSGTELDLRELMPQEESRLRGRAGDAIYYTVVGDQLTLYPKPATGTYRLRYVPQPADLSAAADATTVDVVCSAGEGFLLWGMAVLARVKADDDVQFHTAERERLRAKLREWATMRALLQPRRRFVIDEVDGDRADDLDGSWRFR